MPPRIGPKKPRRVYLALWREHAGLTQEQLGQRFRPEVAKGTVSRWENARPGDRAITKGVIEAYAEALNRPVEDMYRRPEDGPSLDGIAYGLDKDLRERAADFIAALARRKAG